MSQIRHRIAAGVLLEHEHKILLVHHLRPGVHDFWVAPGGGVEDGEDLIAAARREVREECGLEVEVLRIAYLEEFANANLRECKVWFTGRVVGGSLHCHAPEARTESIVQAAWLARADFAGKTIFSPMLLEDYWRDRENGFAFPRYVGLRAMVT